MNIFKKICLFVLCLFVSYLLFYFYLGEYCEIISSTYIHIIIRIMYAVLIYFSIVWVVKGTVHKRAIDMFFIFYFLMIMLMTFGDRISLYSLDIFKSNNIIYQPNFNVLDILSGDKKLIIYNFLVYLPLGYFLCKRLKHTVFNKLYIFIFLVYIFLFETIQFITQTGIFDINDIILNFLGFLVGALLKRKNVVNVLSNT